MSKNVTRRSVLLGTASAAVLAGLSGALVGCTSEETEETTDTSSSSGTGDTWGDADYYPSDYEYSQEGEEQLLADQEDLYKQVTAEGTVLLKNENDALPLSTSDGTVTVFGNAAPVNLGTLNTALSEAGFGIDEACWEFYTNGNTASNGYAVNENPWENVTSADFFSSVSGVALVVLGRYGQEGGDDGWTTDNDYLALSTEEKDLLNGIAELKAAGTFSKFVVVMNTTNSISWEDGDWSDSIDAILQLGQVSELGVTALVSLLDGTENPSGRLADTIYKDNQQNPVMVNFGDIDADLSQLSHGKSDEVQLESDTWKPSSDKGSHWRRNYVYVENIYLGYRYYETRYEDVVLGQGNAGDFSYSDYVAYPFAYGLSYTTFEYSDFAVEEGDDAFEVSVTVTNTGSVAGKHAACVYFQSPYTDYDKENSLEKASIELAGYAKTAKLDAGGSETLTISVPKKELRTYDNNNARTYILDAGDYYFTVAGDSHEAMNNVLAAKGMTTTEGMTAEGDASLVYTWTNAELDTTTYAVSTETGNAITNLFDDVDPNKNDTMSELNNIVWLSRSDWTGTFPASAIHLVYTDEVADMAKPVSYQANSGDATAVDTHEFGNTDSDLMLVDMHGKDYDDEDWEEFVSKLTYEEMVEFINSPESEFAIIGKVSSTAGNGSSGRSETFQISGLTGLSYPTGETRAATFNSDLHTSVGKMTGENMLHASTTESKKVSLYGFSCNMHRSPYSGRNFEYFSEDPFLSGASCAVETEALVGMGCNVYTKHFAGNDQEEYRHGVPSWMNEQALREIYLAPYEKAIVEGNGNGIMTGFHRLGMHWTGESQSLLVDYLEDELGYLGINLTDQFEADYMDSPDGLLNGTHAWLGGQTYEVCYQILLQDDYKSDPVIQDALFKAVKRNLYVYANTLTINGLTHDYVIGAATSSDSDDTSTDNTVITAYSSTAVLGTMTLPAVFYSDNTFTAALGTFLTAYSGTWSYSDSDGLTMTLEDGTEVEIEVDDNETYRWSVESSLGTTDGVVSKYSFVTACNEKMGTSYEVPDEPVYNVTFTCDVDGVTGTDPDSFTVTAGESFTLPEADYTGEYLTFSGWSVNGTEYAAGDSVTAETYEDYAITAVMSVTELLTATTQDSYKFSFLQEDGVPMVLYANGTVRLQYVNGVTSTGTWAVDGSGSGAAELTIMNEAGEAVSLSIDEDERIEYSQEGYYYDWGRPNIGYGSGIFRTTFTHRIATSDFLAAYNDYYGTSYSSVAVTAGTATFAEQEDETAPALGM